MTISTWLMILAFAVGPGTTQPVETELVCPAGRVCKIANNCWINGVWYNPCPSDAPEYPDPPPVLTPEI